MQKINFDVGQKMSYFLATGNLVSQSGLDLQQTTGYTIVAEKLNFYRYLSHFRCIHRGAFFAELKTTTVRKLLPESWGQYIGPSHRLVLTPEIIADTLAMSSPLPQDSSALYTRRMERRVGC